MEIPDSGDDIQSISLRRPPTNQRTSLTLAPVYDDEHGVEKTLGGVEGDYRVLFVMARTGVLNFHSNIFLDHLLRSGDSLIEMPSKQFVVSFSVPLAPIKVVFKRNKQNRLASAEAFVRARNFVEAERAAHYSVLPMLSWWSFRYDAALDVNGYEVTEVSTQIRKFVFGCEGSFRKFEFLPDDTKISSTPELRSIFSSYREGLTATNSSYKCLCFYKVTEGIKAMRAKRRGRDKSNDKLTHPEKLPGELENLIGIDKDSHVAFLPYLGKKYSFVLDQYRELIRNALAHLNPYELTIEADNYDDLRKCEAAITVLKYISREMIRNEIFHQFDVSIIDKV